MRALQSLLIVVILVGCSDATAPQATETPNGLDSNLPIVEGTYRIDPHWTVDLPSKFNQRTEEGSLVLWKPGLTIWMNVWKNDKDETKQARLDSFIASRSQLAYDSKTDSSGNLLRHSYRLAEAADDTREPAFYGFAIGDSGHVQLAVYFNNPVGNKVAQQILNNVAEQKSSVNTRQ